MMSELAIDQFVQNNYWVIILLTVWNLPWKGVALWRAAKNGQMNWFVAMLVLNTLAILEITYIFYFSKTAPRQPLPAGNDKEKDGQRHY